ncbi:MAG: sigma-70 family RNA polymerase sigma factor [Deltaproteobacteria bacterium]|nr:sigma-70 family RNA polymerase sigma factor [Deltaproteobacteria bacterium]
MEVARAAAAGDADARRKLAERLLDRVRTTVTYLAPNHPDRDDLMQRSLIEILRSSGSFRGESSLETWADRIAARTAMRLIKQRARQAEVVTLVADPEPEEFLSGEDEAAKASLRRRLSSLLSRLSPERRGAVVLHYVQGYTVEEIAEITETPANTVRDRLRVGKSLLRKYILNDRVLGESEEGET